MRDGEGPFGPSPSRSRIVDTSGFAAFTRIVETPNNIIYEVIP